MLICLASGVFLAKDNLYSIIFLLSDLVLPRMVFESIRLCLEAWGGLVARRDFFSDNKSMRIFIRRSMASLRFFSWLRKRFALMIIIPWLFIRLSCACNIFLWLYSDKEDFLMSNLRWMAVETLLTFWPPGPCALTAESSMSDSFILSAELTRIN